MKMMSQVKIQWYINDKSENAKCQITYNNYNENLL